MPRKHTSLLFTLIFALSLALLLWWAVFAFVATGELRTAAHHLQDGDIEGAARALGADSVVGLEQLARARRWMFATEGAFFAIVLLAAGWLYRVAVVRENEARRTQDRFLAAATHELKTPLATLVLLLDSLRTGRVPPEKMDRYLGNGLQQAERLRLGLDNVLTEAGLRATRHTGKPQAGDLAIDVREAMGAMEGHAAACSVQLRAELPESLPFLRDPVAIQLVLRNLLDNAIKYSAAGGAVHVALSSDGDVATIRVTDQGRGMDQEELDHAFLAFWRGSDTASGGTGLGLHLARELVTAHRGKITATSAGRDRGCQLTVELPILRGVA
ncbi:MAG: HAMP domain-containing histidine kinase [Planctomycetes bacterium]|nr:HAMP domain-containing histidine kinase [Planctomycetota bacterium]MCB9885742.1 HAMP domain-containing histidine kinase [Planctomycetota bacterium]